MPKRQNKRRFASESVQGEDSYIVVRSLLYGEMAEMRQRADSDGLDDEAVGQLALSVRIVEWNWVDDNDEPMPLPKDDPSVIDRLTGDEVQFILDSMSPPAEEERLKN